MLGPWQPPPSRKKDAPLGKMEYKDRQEGKFLIQDKRPGMKTQEK